MFGFIGEFVDNVVDEVSEFVDNPVSKTVDVATKPIQHGLNIVEGLTEGELRIKAVAYLGVDIVSGMAASELIDWYLENQ